MDPKDWRRIDWQGRLRLLGRSHRIPLWAVVALSAGFALLGGLSLHWAVVGLVGVAAVCALSAWRDAPAASSAINPADDAGATPRDAVWRQVLDAIPDAALLLDSRKIIVAANAGARSVSEFALDGGVSQLRAPDLLKGVDEAITQLKATSFEWHLPVPIERHLAGVATPLQASDPTSPALLIVLRDRTEIERLSELRADFVANASHELRTPLASLKGFIETLQGAAKDDPKARDQFLAIMQEQASRMSRLIDDLLSLSRIEMREHVAPTTTVDLAAIVDGAMTELIPLAESAGIKLSLRELVEPVRAIGDRDELAQVLQNLIQNAIKYGKPGGKVDVSMRRTPDGQRVRLVVSDDGIGIAPEHLPRLTERFYRVSAKESRERGGTGLGLAIVKHIVNRHRGELRIESELGKGSTFTVLLSAL